jgi:hypothetical protein
MLEYVNKYPVLVGVASGGSEARLRGDAKRGEPGLFPSLFQTRACTGICWKLILPLHDERKLKLCQSCSTFIFINDKIHITKLCSAFKGKKMHCC